MKIAIPVENNEGLHSKVFSHFGSAPFFIIFDTHTQAYEVIDNSSAHHRHGTCHPMSQLDAKDIDCVVCGGMGLRAIQRLNEAGIQAYRVNNVNMTAQDLLEQFQSNNLTKITVEDVCRNHDCH